jgi:hypothetical protein
MAFDFDLNASITYKCRVPSAHRHSSKRVALIHKAVYQFKTPKIASLVRGQQGLNTGGYRADCLQGSSNIVLVIPYHSISLARSKALVLSNACGETPLSSGRNSPSRLWIGEGWCLEAIPAT